MAAKGQPKSGGRKKGTPNRVTGEVRAMLLQALEDEGGVDYLREMARKQPVAFLSLVARLIPSELRASVDETVVLQLRDYTGLTKEQHELLNLPVYASPDLPATRRSTSPSPKVGICGKG